MSEKPARATSRRDARGLHSAYGDAGSQAFHLLERGNPHLPRIRDQTAPTTGLDGNAIIPTRQRSPRTSDSIEPATNVPSGSPSISKVEQRALSLIVDLDGKAAQLLAVHPSSPADEAFVSVVVPTYGEADNLLLLVPRISAALEDRRHEIIIVDDNSQDGTDQAVASLRKEGHAVRLIVRIGQRGLSSAVLRGFAEAKGEVLVCMDADLSHPPETLPHMIQTLEGGDVDFVIGSRYVQRWHNRCGMELVPQAQ